MMRPTAAALTIGAIALALAGSPGKATEESDFVIDTAADLATLCGTAPEHPMHTAAVHMCHGYLMGLHHMHFAVEEAMGGGIYCIPAENPPSRNQVVADYVAWTVARSDADSIEAVDSVLLFAAETFPCS